MNKVVQFIKLVRSITTFHFLIDWCCCLNVWINYGYFCIALVWFTSCEMCEFEWISNKSIPSITVVSLKLFSANLQPPSKRNWCRTTKMSFNNSHHRLLTQELLLLGCILHLVKYDNVSPTVQEGSITKGFERDTKTIIALSSNCSAFACQFSPSLSLPSIVSFKIKSHTVQIWITFRQRLTFVE